MKASFEITTEEANGNGERWPSLVIQSIVLSVSLGFFLSERGNSFFLASVFFILSIFVLQTINRRFLWLYPFNNFVKRPSPHIDTYILRIFIWLSIIFLFLGIAKSYTKSSVDIPYSFFTYLVAIGFVILPVLFWILTSFEITNKLIAKKLARKPADIPSACPKCGAKEAKVIHKIHSHTEGELIIQCKKCEGDTSKVRIWVG